MQVTFTIDFVPTKRRPRFARGRAYDPSENVKEGRAIQAAYNKQCGVKFDGAVSVSIKAHKHLPKSTPKKIESQQFIAKPDADNIAKAILDALNGIAYEDDAHVTRLTVQKTDRERQGDYTQVTIWGDE